MTWWNSKSKPEDEISDPEQTIGSYVFLPSTTLKSLPPVPPTSRPEPDMSTKPKDVVGYCFGYVCPKKHVNSPFENITVDGYKERRACNTCGGVAKPAVVKRTAEAVWMNISSPSPFCTKLSSFFSWTQKPWFNDYNIVWTKYEFVHYLDTPKPRKRK